MDNVREEEEKTLGIHAEDPAYHEIRIYNTVRDSIWQELVLLEYENDIDKVEKRLINLYLLLLRADEIWNEINESVKVQSTRLRLVVDVLPYEGEFRKYAEKINTLIEIKRNAKMLCTSAGSPEVQQMATTYLQLPFYSKVEWLKKEAEKIVDEVGRIWGSKAAKIQYTMPIQIKESADPFF
ncbi:MAG: hypothetical protein ACP5HJ_01725 [Candidatus Micrarchaeia archaeon]